MSSNSPLQDIKLVMLRVFEKSELANIGKVAVGKLHLHPNIFLDFLVL